MKAVWCLALAAEVADALNADEIPRVNTPGPGPWPQDGVTGCGILGLPPVDMLADCDEPMDPAAPDLNGYWRTPEGHIDEFIAMCGKRWIDVSSSVIHDHPVCDGTLAGGVKDYSGPDIATAEDPEFNNDLRCRGLCTSITTAGKFEKGDGDVNCVNLYTDTLGFGFLSLIVQRCLNPADGTMTWIHPVAGTVIYSKVEAGDEPNCMECPDGQRSTDVTHRLGCRFDERHWKTCTNMTGWSVPEPEQVSFCKVTSSNPNGPLILTIVLLVLVCGCGLLCYFCRKPAAETESNQELASS